MICWISYVVSIPTATEPVRSYRRVSICFQTSKEYSSHSRTMARMLQPFWQIELLRERWRTPKNALGPHLPREPRPNANEARMALIQFKYPKHWKLRKQSKHQPSSPAESRQLYLQDRTCINPAIRHIVSVCDAAFDTVSPITP